MENWHSCEEFPICQEIVNPVYTGCEDIDEQEEREEGQHLNEALLIF